MLTGYSMYSDTFFVQYLYLCIICTLIQNTLYIVHSIIYYIIIIKLITYDYVSEKQCQQITKQDIPSAASTVKVTHKYKNKCVKFRNPICSFINVKR